MKASQVMTRNVITIPADATVYAAAGILLGAGISAAPVLDPDGTMVGIVSEADLMNRPEIGTVPSRSWLQRLTADDASLARDYARSHSHRVADVMTRDVVTAGEEADLLEVAGLMQRHRIRRLPIVRDGRVVGIVSRSSLLRGLLSRAAAPAGEPAADDRIREAVASELGRQPWGGPLAGSVIVDEGVVHIWGMVESQAVRDAARVAAENVPGVRRVVDNTTLVPPGTRLGL